MPADIQIDLSNTTVLHTVDTQLSQLLHNFEGLFQGTDGPREEWVRSLHNHFHQSYPGYGVMVIHPKHEIHGPEHSWMGVHKEFKKTWGTVGFTVYVIRKGSGTVVTNLGDGGFINWCFSGHSRRDGSVATF
ncbi:MAG: hypothetical protein J0L84_03675 [Verrucomicrobia bacterium]|nr:hypothetical protein [Verrucomicrobiota bacterium]